MSCASRHSRAVKRRATLLLRTAMPMACRLPTSTHSLRARVTADQAGPDWLRLKYWQFSLTGIALGGLGTWASVKTESRKLKTRLAALERRQAELANEVDG